MSAWANDNSQGAEDEIAIPDVVAKVNGVEIKSAPIKFQLSSSMRKGKRSFTPAEKQKMVSNLVEKEIVRELVHQEGKAAKVEIDSESVEKRVPGRHETL